MHKMSPVARRWGLRPPRRHPSATGERGQTLAEFALVATPLFITLFAIIQLGLLFGSQVGLSNAARESARHASTVITSTSSHAATNAAATCADLRNARLPQAVPAFSAANLTASAPRTRVGFYYYVAPGTSPAKYSVRVIVEVQYRQLLLVPIISAMLDGFDGSNDNRLRLGAREEMRVEGPLLVAAPAGIGFGAPASWVSC